MASSTPTSEMPVKIRMPKLPREGTWEGNKTQDPNVWFASMFPKSVELFGAAFLQGTWLDLDKLPHVVPVDLNEDFFAHALGGDRTLGHRVIYYLPEQRWY